MQQLKECLAVFINLTFIHSTSLLLRYSPRQHCECSTFPCNEKRAKKVPADAPRPALKRRFLTVFSCCFLVTGKHLISCTYYMLLMSGWLIRLKKKRPEYSFKRCINLAGNFFLSCTTVHVCGTTGHYLYCHLFKWIRLCVLPQCFIFGIALMYRTTPPLHLLNCTSVVGILNNTLKKEKKEKKDASTLQPGYRFCIVRRVYSILFSFIPCLLTCS